MRKELKRFMVDELPHSSNIDPDCKHESEPIWHKLRVKKVPLPEVLCPEFITGDGITFDRSLGHRFDEPGVYKVTMCPDCATPLEKTKIEGENQ